MSMSVLMICFMDFSYHSLLEQELQGGDELILYRTRNSGHASVQTSGFSLTLRNRGKGGWARDLRAELFAAV